MHGTNEPRLVGIVADCVANFGNQARQRSIRHERSRPKPLVNLELRDGFRASSPAGARGPGRPWAGDGPPRPRQTVAECRNRERGLRTILAPSLQQKSRKFLDASPDDSGAVGRDMRDYRAALSALRTGAHEGAAINRQARFSRTYNTVASNKTPVVVLIVCGWLSGQACE